MPIKNKVGQLAAKSKLKPASPCTVLSSLLSFTPTQSVLEQCKRKAMGAVVSTRVCLYNSFFFTLSICSRVVPSHPFIGVQSFTSCVGPPWATVPAKKTLAPAWTAAALFSSYPLSAGSSVSYNRTTSLIFSGVCRKPLLWCLEHLLVFPPH